MKYILQLQAITYLILLSEVAIQRCSEEKVYWKYAAEGKCSASVLLISISWTNRIWDIDVFCVLIYWCDVV